MQLQCNFNRNVGNYSVQMQCNNIAVCLLRCIRFQSQCMHITSHLCWEGSKIKFRPKTPLIQLQHKHGRAQLRNRLIALITQTHRFCIYSARVFCGRKESRASLFVHSIFNCPLILLAGGLFNACDAILYIDRDRFVIRILNSYLVYQKPINVP